MAHQSRVVVAALALSLVTACSEIPANKPAAPTPSATPSTASGPAAAVQTSSYQATGVVKRLDPKLPAIEIDHGDIEGLMPAMQMEFPVTDVKLLDGLAVNDRIDFTVTTDMKVTAIKKK